MSPSPSPEARPPAFVAAGRDGLEAWLKVTPAAPADAVLGLVAEADGRLRLRLGVTAAADRGRANAAVLALLAKEWSLPKSRMAIGRGAADRRKTVTVQGDPGVLAAHIGAWAARRGLA